MNMTALIDSRMSPGYLRAVSDFVRHEVIYCVTGLVSELAKDEKYRDNLMPVLSRATESDPEEAYEHWIVSEWMADKLEAKGEMILRDFLGLTIWGRTTTGQAIAMDGVIQDIYDETQRA